MTEVLLDAVIDSIKILPFLFLAYLAMEWIESRENERTVHMIRKSGRFGPVAACWVFFRNADFLRRRRTCMQDA